MSSGDYLAHHGVLGMHWGVRKDRPSSKKKTKKAKKASELSDEELDKLINRMQKEQQYNRLVGENSSSFASKETKQLLKRYGSKAVTTLATVAATSAVAYVTSKAGSKTLSQIYKTASKATANL